MAFRENAPSGRFFDSEAKALFRDLASGAEAQFLSAATQFTKRLNAEMDRRTDPGLLVALRAVLDDQRVAGVLKLEVVAEHAAVLDQLDNGEIVLSAARNVMDQPGDLKKGALTRTDLVEHEVLVGDQLTKAAAYFFRALGIRLHARPTDAARELFVALSNIEPELLAPVARNLSAVSPGELKEVLQALQARVPELTEDVQLSLVDRLENLSRPVGRVNTQKAYRQVLRAGPIQVSGPVADMHELVRVEPTREGCWQVRIDLDERPEVDYK
ncbi:MAG TPA: hypothetical protein VI076_16125 [Actinopolymorphaceae bacterium]